MCNCTVWKDLFTDMPVLVSKDMGCNHTSQTNDVVEITATLCFSFRIGKMRQRIASGPEDCCEGHKGFTKKITEPVAYEVYIWNF